MSSVRRRSASIAATLATTTRDVRRAVRDADPAHPPGLVPLRDTGWQLTQLTGELINLIAVLAEHTGHHAERVRKADGGPATDQLAHACRDLAALRRALDTANAAARDYYSAISHLAPTTAPERP